MALSLDGTNDDANAANANSAWDQDIISCAMVFRVASQSIQNRPIMGFGTGIGAGLFTMHVQVGNPVTGGDYRINLSNKRTGTNSLNELAFDLTWDVWYNVVYTFNRNSGTAEPSWWVDGVSRSNNPATAGGGSRSTGEDSIIFGANIAQGNNCDVEWAWWARWGVILDSDVALTLSSGYHPDFFKHNRVGCIDFRGGIARDQDENYSITINGAVKADHPDGLFYPGEQDVQSPEDTIAALGVGSFSIDGQDPNINAETLIASGAGSFQISGQDIGILQAFGLDVGSFSFSGQDVNVNAEEVVQLTAGSFSFSGQDMTLLQAIRPGVGSFNITGQDVSFLFSDIISVSTGTFNIDGQSVVLQTGAPKLGRNVTRNIGRNIAVNADYILH